MTMQDPKDLDGAPLELLIKFMRMTQAEDNIALVAIRKANAHLAKLGADWEAVLRGKVKVIADPFTSINIPEARVNPNRNQPFAPPPTPPRAPPRPQYNNPNPSWNAPPPPRRQPQPARNLADPGPNNGTAEKRIVNKFDGTCHKCQGKVPAGHGISVLWRRSDGKTKWVSEHDGPCPSATRTRPATTTDNFQV